jgi:hypothetical protein
METKFSFVLEYVVCEPRVSVEIFALEEARKDNGVCVRTGFTPLKGFGTTAESRRMPGKGNVALMSSIRGPARDAWSAAAEAGVRVMMGHQSKTSFHGRGEVCQKFSNVYRNKEESLATQTFGLGHA